MQLTLVAALIPTVAARAPYDVIQTSAAGTMGILLVGTLKYARQCRGPLFLCGVMIIIPTLLRIGEAQNPGPTYWLGTSNPTGIVRKEFVYSLLPEGLWGASETHLILMANERYANLLT